MSKRRQPGDIVRRKPGSCFVGSAEPELVRLTDETDGKLHGIDSCLICDDLECQEWANAQVVGAENEWMYHLSECQMEDTEGKS